MKPIIAWLLASLLLAASTASAQTTLRWQLKQGDRLTIETQQQTTSKVSYVGKETATQIDLALTLGWGVTSADDEVYTIKQSVRRLLVGIDSAAAGKVEYDSAKRIQPTGAARDIEEAVAPLLKAELQLTMNARGEIVDAQPLGEAAEKLLAAGGEQGGAAATAGQSMQQLLRQPLVVLPEKEVNPGDAWTRETKLTTPLGPATQTTTYKYVGPAESDKDLALIETTGELKLTMPAAPGKGVALKEHAQSGSILFSTAAGRLARAEQTQTLVTERPYRETTIVVSLSSKQTTTVTSADAGEKPEASP
jgi:hypothetical protein